MCCNGKVCSVSIFPVVLLGDYVRGNQLRKIVHSKSCKYLLENVFRLFCVKMEKSNGVFQLSERSFNAPSHSIELFQFVRSKGIGGQISDHGFKRVFGYGKADNTKRQPVKFNRIMFSACFRQIIKDNAAGNDFIFVSLFAQLLNIIGLSAG